ncbi:hypothetical protein PHSC3_000122 [Chlamydiales bacterium STE3]|nr:hypothetical protein PHSC3_000122 [Chlamydiales bacterium STE3]
MNNRREEGAIGHSEVQGVVFGLVSGAILGAAATLLLSSKTGEAIKDNLSETCGDWSEKTKHFADSLSETFPHTGKKHSSNNLNKIIGGIAGSVLGISAIIFLSSNASKGLRQQLAHTFEILSDKGHEMAHGFSETAHDTCENAEEHLASWAKAAQDAMSYYSKQHEARHSLPEKALYWTLLGIRFLQGLKKEER